MNKKGAVLFETIFLVQILIVVLFASHFLVIKKGKREIEELQSKRLFYSGVIKWKQ